MEQPATALVIHALIEDVARLEFDLVGYRELVKVAIELLHGETRKRAALQEQMTALREEIRRYVAAKVA